MKLDDLLAKARQATPGPWKLSEGRTCYRTDELMYGVEGPAGISDWEDWGYTLPNAAYIAACDPQTLISLIEGYQGAVEALRSTTGALNSCRMIMSQENSDLAGEFINRGKAALATFDALNAEEGKAG